MFSLVLMLCSVICLLLTVASESHRSSLKFPGCLYDPRPGWVPSIVFFSVPSFGDHCNSIGRLKGPLQYNPLALTQQLRVQVCQ
jgi:hypothetical protein